MRRGKRDDSKIISFISQQKHVTSHLNCLSKNVIMRVATQVAMEKIRNIIHQLYLLPFLIWSGTL